MNMDSKTLIISLRRTFDWRGGSGIEMFTDDPEIFIYADTFLHAKEEIKPYLPKAAAIIFRIEPSMKKEEFHQLNDALLNWHAEAE